MAKQTFTTGQVLTAAQMTSLQETAMGGGPATAKTASYVLVAADAGTTVAMNAAGATTITVNTGLFAAGDTVFIQNLGAGACTVTAGTATVATAGSLILPQNDAGILYFTATGAAIFYDYIQVGAASPLTTKGDLYTYSTSDARLAVGANGTTLVADSAEATGLKWAAAGGGMTLINTGGTALSGTSTSISSIPTTYKHLYCVVINASISGGTTYYSLRLNNDSTTGNYLFAFSGQYDGTANLGEDPNASHFYGLTWADQSANSSCYEVSLPRYTDTVANQFVTSQGFTEVTSTQLFSNNMQGIYKKSAAITSIQFQTQNGSSTFATGTVYVYGVS